MKDRTIVIISATCGCVLYWACFALISYLYWNTGIGSGVATVLLAASLVMAYKVTMKIGYVLTEKKELV